MKPTDNPAAGVAAVSPSGPQERTEWPEPMDWMWGAANRRMEYQEPVSPPSQELTPDEARRAGLSVPDGAEKVLSRRKMQIKKDWRD